MNTIVLGLISKLLVKVSVFTSLWVPDILSLDGGFHSTCIF